jgi:polyisoprenoid-binding protein YceI
LFATVGLLLAGTACSQSTPAAAPVRATDAPATPPGEAAASAPSTSAADLSISLLASGSKARYEVREQLLGRPLPNTAVGTTETVAGSIEIDEGQVVPEQSKVIVDLRTLRSDEGMRDNFIQRNTLQTAQYPTAEFVPREARGAPAAPPASGEVRFELLGDLTVRGTTRPVVWDVVARFDGPAITGEASTQVNLTDFGMTPPRAGPVISIEDGITLVLEFQGTTNPPAAGSAVPAGPLAAVNAFTKGA